MRTQVIIARDLKKSKKISWDDSKVFIFEHFFENVTCVVCFFHLIIFVVKSLDIQTLFFSGFLKFVCFKGKVCLEFF